MLFYRIYRDSSGKRVAFLQGNEACVEGALLAGVNFFAGYPITPSSEIATVASAKFPQNGGRFMQMEDEIASMAACIGAAMAGGKTMSATSGPGFSLKQENIGYACICEVPTLIVNVQRAGPSTGLPTQVSQGDVMQSRWGTHGDHPIIVLSPRNVGEVVYLTIEAVNLSEKYRTPVILLMDETVAHMREKVTLPDADQVERIERKKPTVPPSRYLPFDTRFGDVPPFAPFGSGYRYNITGLIHDRAGFPTTKPEEIVEMLDRIHNKIYGNLDDIVKVKEYNAADCDYLLIAFGSSVNSCLGAMEIAEKSSLHLGVLQLITVWPFADAQVEKALQNKKRVFMVEMNRGQLINEVRRVAGGRVEVEGINKYDGTLITPEEVIDALARSCPSAPLGTY
jgi:2-oxoglutarate ferredoxin oxidoreductase subunit alpha